ncbi:metallophosphoesterase [bacterium]|nr:metallophosphoesterase [bacterium]
MHKFIKKVLLSFFTIFLIQNFVCADTIEFAQISDVHYSYENKTLDKYLYFLSLSLKKKYPDFAVFLGDNVDKSKEENVIGFMRSINSIRTPYYVVLGHTDAYSLSGLEKKDYLDIVTTFNRNQDDRKNFYYFKPNSDFVCVVLDDSSDFAPSKHGEITDEQIEWLDNLLTKYSKRLFIIFHHGALLPPRVEYKLSMLNTEKYSSMLEKHNNVILISSGHYHQEAIQQDERGVRHISAPSFKDTPHSYQLIKVIYDMKTYKSPKDVEITVSRIKV